MPNKAVIHIEGHVGRGGAEIKTQKDGGKEFAVFSVAVSNNYKDKNTNEWVERPATWYSVLCNKNLNSICERVQQGIGVSVTGKPYINTYQGKDGSSKSSIQIWASDVAVICYDKREGDYPTKDLPADFEMSDDASNADIPF